MAGQLKCVSLIFHWEHCIVTVKTFDTFQVGFGPALNVSFDSRLFKILRLSKKNTRK